ncbi:hypothetical protein J6590_030518 [Homalodisca vitripennis]|nr:hypothetical protein J6590_030518 [Homalodisca vitripennis]
MYKRKVHLTDDCCALHGRKVDRQQIYKSTAKRMSWVAGPDATLKLKDVEARKMSSENCKTACKFELGGKLDSLGELRGSSINNTLDKYGELLWFLDRLQNFCLGS